MAITGNLLPANAESVETDASAWVALTNSTNPLQANGGTLGSKSMNFRSIAAGDVQIGLAARVTVTPGAEHWACASVFPPGVGAMSRIEIRWYTAGGSLISTSAGPYVTASAATWHQVGAVGTAPANAAKADVVIRPNASVANQSWFADRIFLGLTAVSTGNLLPFNTETAEVDASGWFAATNCLLSVSTAAFMWYQSLLVTSSAAGAVMTRTALSQAPTVTPGVEYVAYAYVTPSVSGLPLDIRIYWRDASGTEISSSSSTWTPATSQWTRVAVVDTAPPNAAAARIAVAPTATAAGQQWAVDRAVLAPTSALMVSGNLLPYNTSDFEVNTSGWTITGGTSARTAEQVLTGSYAMKLVAGGGDVVATITTPVTGIVEGLGYQFAPCLYQTIARTYQTRIEWLNSAGDAVRTRWQSWASSPGGWRAPAMGDLAPEGAASVRLSLIVPDAALGEVLYLDRVQLTLGGLTVKAEAAGGGGAAITLRGLTTGGPTYNWSLVRIVTGSGSLPVRGWTGDLTSQPVIGDIAVARDYEAPLGVPVQWRVILTDAGGVVRLTYTSDPITLDAEITDVWLKDPGLPQRSVKVTVATPMPTWATPARQGVSRVRGRRLPVVISDVRGGKTGDLTVVTETTADREALDWVLASGSPLLLQWPPGWGEEDMYVSIGDVQAAPVVDYSEFHDRTWVLPLTEVDRPIGGVTGSADRTWQTVKDDGSTWSEVLSGATTWLDVYSGA
ncbi:hypothetical protein M2271_003542 [Streptomyces sp. LBL]|uniref:hypothetical protein n=1 Tax=Streptomyces sp. LBL TaxID=2940562 RepID=UPI0024756338|nr:hypothetical protein [Streptomyces sp. LBL]MDH6625731.1 hypothetical protein [Streptomyces sp. LBL]